MLLSLVLHTYSLRYALPAAVMLGTAPTYLLAWGAWRLLSALLPARLYHQVDDRLYTLYQSMVLFFFEHYTGVQIILYGDLPKMKENVIYISNHQCTVDWIIADMLAVRQNALGHVRYVLKDGLKWLPMYGWYFAEHGGVYVKRSAKFDEKKMRNKLQAQTKAKTPMYLVIFPEGTRYNPELPKVIADSQLYAEKEGLAVLKHVLTPRVKATHVAVDSMKDYLDAIYDVTVAYEGTVDQKGQRKVAPSMTDTVETTNYEATLDPATRLALLRKRKQRSTAAARLDNTLTGFVDWVKASDDRKESTLNAWNHQDMMFQKQVIDNLRVASDSLARLTQFLTTSGTKKKRFTWKEKSPIKVNTLKTNLKS